MHLAHVPSVGAWLVGDRFLEIAAGTWRDIATGETVSVEPTLEPPGGAALERRVAVSGQRDLQSQEEVARSVDRIVRTAEVRDGNGIRALRVTMTRAPVRDVLVEAAPSLQRLGWVSILDTVDLPVAVRQALTHRHVVVFSCERPARDEPSRVVTWIRDLSRVSTRAHLVVLVGSDRDRALIHARSEGRGFFVRERSVDYGSDTRLLRAARFRLRQRHAAAGRWLRAAVESARRRGDRLVAEQGWRQLVSYYLDLNQWATARTTAVAGLRHTIGWRARVELGALAARALVACGDLRDADALIQAIAVEATVRGEETPASILVRLAEVRFWQGRFEEAAACLVACSRNDPEVAVWDALTSWSRGDPTALETAGRLLGSTSALARAVLAEAHLSAGDNRAAERALVSMPRGRGRATEIERALLDWLEGRCAADAECAPPGAVVRLVQATGARGLLRWGLGRRAMNLLHGVSALLQVIHDADDEYAALRHGCSWVREHTAAEAVGIVGREGTTVVAGDGLAAADLNNEDLRLAFGTGRGRTIAEGPHAIVTSPMRYVGATIGFAVVRGGREKVETLVEAATALASACAPALRARLDALTLVGAGQSLVGEILGLSLGVGAMREAIARAAATPFPVLVEGESGTGKELVARALHRLSARRDRRFFALNCAALTDELAEAELFGHTKGAFTGAVNARAGLFEEASGSTLFLDEVSELSPRAQAKLLRVLQEREIRRLGEHAPRPVDIRIVSATNLPLAEGVANGKFREDLLFRLAVVRIGVPPLRDRIEDVPVLAQAFWRRLSGEAGKKALLSPDAVAALCRHHWPGNVRELQNVVAGLVVAAPTRGRVSARHVAQILGAGTPDEGGAGGSLDTARQAFERRMVAATLARHGGRRTSAALELGLSRQGLAKAIKRLGIGEEVRRVS